MIFIQAIPFIYINFQEVHRCLEQAEVFFSCMHSCVHTWDWPFKLFHSICPAAWQSHLSLLSYLYGMSHSGVSSSMSIKTRKCVIFASEIFIFLFLWRSKICHRKAKQAVGLAQLAVWESWLSPVASRLFFPFGHFQNKAHNSQTCSQKTVPQHSEIFISQGLEQQETQQTAGVHRRMPWHSGGQRGRGRGCCPWHAQCISYNMQQGYIN